MMRDLSELNINDGMGRPVQRSAPTREDIESFQKEFGVELPEDYVKLLQHSNGGCPELGCFLPEGAQEDNLWEVDNFYHLHKLESEQIGSLWWAMRAWREYVGEKSIPIGCDGCDNQILIDLSCGGAVFVCIHDQNFKRIRVAGSISQFLRLLREDPNMI